MQESSDKNAREGRPFLVNNFVPNCLIHNTRHQKIYNSFSFVEQSSLCLLTSVDPAAWALS